MVRIKGWKKVKENKYETIYSNGNNEKLKLLTIIKLPSSIFYEVYISNGKHLIEWGKKFKTKQSALKFAYTWMKKHPRG